MADFKDKAWDAKYEQFKMMKKRRQQTESQVKPSSAIPISTGAHRGNTSQKVEDSPYRNRGPSRFLRTHNSQVNPAKPALSQVQVVKEQPNVEQPQMIFEESHEEERSKFSWGEVIPYAIIVLAIAAVLYAVLK